MSSPADPKLMDHEYDGIQEFDNPTPGWWHLIFAGSVIFSLFYFAYYEYSPLSPTPYTAWEARQQDEFRRLFGALGQLENDDATLKKTMTDERLMLVAKGIFLGNCAQCHGTEAAGMAGSNCPNLTDDRWKNVKKATDIFNVITKGANNGAMPSWENRLSPNERLILAAFVAGLRDKPVSGRAPEGDPVAPWFGPAEGK